MDRSDVIKLIKENYEADKIGQRISKESERTVFCNVKSITRQEFFEAGRNGLKPALTFEIFAYDYDGEKIIEYQGRRYGVYRTYRGKHDKMDLYTEEKAGLKNGKD